MQTCFHMLPGAVLTTGAGQQPQLQMLLCAPSECGHKHHAANLLCVHADYILNAFHNYLTTLL